MWPWEHLAVGYIAVSLLVRRRAQRVDDRLFAAVLLGSQFPDLVDKPLAWTFEVLPSGTTLAHSVFVALPLGLAVLAWGRRRGDPWLAVAFVVPYLCHLPCDALYAALTVGGQPSFDAILWPLVPKAPGGKSTGLIGETLYYLGRYRTFLARPEAVRYLLLEAALLSTALALWVGDERPGLGLFGDLLRRFRSWQWW
jgi:hypothetical protein